jgi:hypothetical protein
MGGAEAVAVAIDADLFPRLPLQNKRQCEALALIVTTALHVRDVNLNALGAAIPQADERSDMRLRWTSCLLGNGLIVVDHVMVRWSGHLQF